MKRKIAFLLILSMILSFVKGFNAFAAAFSISDIYAERTSIEVNFFTPPANNANISVTLTKAQGGTPLVFNAGSNKLAFAAGTDGGVTMKVNLDTPLDLGFIYILTVTEGTITATKYFRLVTLLSDNFDYADNAAIQEKWKTLSNGLLQSTNEVLVDTVNHRMLLPYNASKRCFVSTDDVQLSALSAASPKTVQLNKWTDYVIEYDATVQNVLTPNTNDVFFETAVRNGTSMYLSTYKMPYLRNNQFRITNADTNLADLPSAMPNMSLTGNDQLSIKTSLRGTAGVCTVKKNGAAPVTLSTNLVSSDNGCIGFINQNAGVYIDNLKVYKFEETTDANPVTAPPGYVYKGKSIIDYDNNIVDLNNGLVAKWDFDEENGETVVKDSVGGNDGNMIAGQLGLHLSGSDNVTPDTNEKVSFVDPTKYSGALSTVDGMPGLKKRKNGAVGNYIGFYNAGACVKINTKSNLPIAMNNQYSISLWVKSPAAPNRNNQIVYMERGSGLASFVITLASRNIEGLDYSDGGFLKIVITDENGQTILSKVTEGYPFDQSWHQVTWLDNHGKAAIYIDGERDSVNFNYDATRKGVLTQAYIGTPKDLVTGYTDKAANFYYGAVDNMCMYNRVISQAEMKALFYQSKTEQVAQLSLDSNLNDEEKNAVVTGNAAYVDGIDKKALSLNSEVSFATHPAYWFDKTFTFAAWVKKVDGNGKATLIARGANKDDFVLKVSDKAEFSLKQKNGSIVTLTSSSSLPTNKWIHVAVTANGKELSLYVDAVKESSEQYDGSIINTGNLYVGGSEDFTGAIDDIRIYNYGCSQTEIKYYQDMQPDYIKNVADRLYAMLKKDDPNMHEIIQQYQNGSYSNMLELYRDYYFNNVKENAEYLLDGSPESTGIFIAYDDEKLNYTGMESTVSYDQLGEPGNINWTLGGYGELQQYYNLSVDHWYWSVMNMASSQFRMFWSFRQEEYYELYSKILRDLAINRYDQIDSQLKEMLKVGFQQPLHPTVSQKVVDMMTETLERFIIEDEELARKYFSPTMLVEVIEECTTRYYDSLMGITTQVGNHEIEGSAVLSPGLIIYNSLAYDKVIIDYMLNYLKVLIDTEYMKDGTGKEVTWHYNAALPKFYGKVVRIFEKMDIDNYLTDRLKEMIKYRSRMIYSHIMPYGSSFIGAGSSGGADLWAPSYNYGGKDALDNIQLVGLQDTEYTKEDPLLKQLVNTSTGTGTYPSFTSITFPYAGISSLRTGWNDNDQYLFFKGGVLREKDNGARNTLQLAANGRLLLGRAGHTQGNQSIGIQGAYAYGSYGENTVLVDGYTQQIDDSNLHYYRTVPYQNRFHTSNYFDFTESTLSDGYVDLMKWYMDNSTGDISALPVKVSDVSHTRQVFSLRDKGLYIVLDRLSGSNQHTYTQNWHIPSSFPESTINITNNSLITQDNRAANVALYQFTTDNITSEKYYGYNDGSGKALGWEMRAYNGTWDKATDVRFNWQGQGESLLVTVITPMSNLMETIQSKTNLSTVNGDRGFEIVMKDGSRVQFLASTQGTKEYTFDNITANAKALLVLSQAGQPARGIVLDANSFKAGSVTENIQGVNNFEFEFDGSNVTKTDIKIPNTFRWEENGEKITPVYDESQISASYFYITDAANNVVYTLNDDQEIYAKANFNNLYGGDTHEREIYVALYNRDGKLIDISQADAKILPNEEKTISVKYKFPSDLLGCYAKAFIWNARNLCPIEKAIKLVK